MDDELVLYYDRLGIITPEGTKDRKTTPEELRFLLSQRNYQQAESMKHEPAIKIYKWMLHEIKRQQEIEMQLLNQQLDQESLNHIKGDN